MSFCTDILDLDARVVFVPVRHHSPACARLVFDLILETRPAAVLIEGPSDFNERMDELYREHELPIAIYSHVLTDDQTRRGAFYPFCVHSPEWQAILAAAETGACARFVDMPWASLARFEVPEHRYADGELRSSTFVDALTRELGVEGFDALWDTLFEIPTSVVRASLFERLHRFCWGLRAFDAEVPATDARRERFMIREIRRMADDTDGRVVVVTGGYHSHALFDGLRLGDTDAETVEDDLSGVERGIALTPYSFERLDSLAGYESGMPNPGFYHHAWMSGDAVESHRALLAAAVKSLRGRGQPLSSADLIAVDTTAHALAGLRGHDRVWRTDLIDAIASAVVKDDVVGMEHPFLVALHDVFRGDARGRLAEGTPLPPLVDDIRRSLTEMSLEPAVRERTVELDLTNPDDLRRSALLHRLQIIGVAGFRRAGGTNLLEREDLTRVVEQWKIRWTPELEASYVEASIYGASTESAAAARLAERSHTDGPTAEVAAEVLLDAALAGLPRPSDDFVQQLCALIRADSNFFGVSRALGHLHFLYCYDWVLGTTGHAGVGHALRECFDRAVWLLEILGQVSGMESDVLSGVSTLARAFESCEADLELNRDELVDALRRIAGSPRQSPMVQGAAVGLLWRLRAAGSEDLLGSLRSSGGPSALGDFLNGVFALARETVQRHQEIVLAIDSIVVDWDDGAYLEALPALRLAFSYFTPREKHYLASTLLKALGIDDTGALPRLEVSAETAAGALAFESRVLKALATYGLRGGLDV